MYIPEDSLKQLIIEIVKDLAARVEKKDFNDLIEQYLNLESTETGLASFIIDIINNNMSSINLDEVINSKIEEYLNDHPITHECSITISDTQPADKTLLWIDKSVEQNGELKYYDEASDTYKGLEISPVVLDYINEQIRNSANNISNPFDKAYWKDTLNDNVYLVEIKEGKMNIVDVNDQNSEETT